MYEKKIPKDLSCGLNIAVEVIGGKWKPNILANISKGIKRPFQLHRSIPQASARVLNRQLSELEYHGILKKIIDVDHPLRVEYEITPDGESILQVLIAMKAWGENYKQIFYQLCNFAPLRNLSSDPNQQCG